MEIQYHLTPPEAIAYSVLKRQELLSIRNNQHTARWCRIKCDDYQKYTYR